VTKETPLSDATLAKLVVQDIRSHGIVGLSPDGIILAWTPGAEDITGFTRAEVMGRHFRMLFLEADQAAGMPEGELQTALADGRAEDSRWHGRKNGSLFWANGVTVSFPDKDVLVKIFRDETEAKRAEEQRILLLNELNHRVKNTLATVQSITEQALRSAGVEERIRNELTQRLLALSRAHNVLVDDNWAGADLRTLICEVLAPYEGEPSPIHLDGPTVRLHPSQAVGVSLACHELATNAAKYGALSVPHGQVQIGWNVAHNGRGERFLTLLWAEQGGPPVQPPTRRGFGTKLIAHTFSSESGSRAEVSFPPDGARCVMVLALRDDDLLKPPLGSAPADAVLPS
jgi:PAS domain S-box-containing protein